jgi:hypothetical protein
MKWQIGGVFFSVPVLLKVAASIAGDVELPLSVRDEYRRPTEIPFPDDNPYSAAKVDLGRRLFFDPIFSNSQSLSCASCHEPNKSWGDGRAKAHGEKDLALRSPTLLNVAWTPRLGWDGKFRNIEAVAFTPITAPAAMNLKETELIERLRGEPDYVRAFADIFRMGLPAAILSRHSRRTNERSFRARPRSTAGLPAMRARLTRSPNADLTFSMARADVLLATAVGPSPMALSTTSEPRKIMISDAVGYFRHRKSSAMRSKLRRCATSLYGHLICMMVRSQRGLRSSISTTVAVLSGQAGQS